MSLSQKEEVRQILALLEKSTQDLALLCEGMGLSPLGEREELVKRLRSLNIAQQTNVSLPQLLALRIKFLSNKIPEATSFLERIRKLIDKGSDNLKEFSLLNSKGSIYVLRLRYLIAKDDDIKFILENKMIYPMTSQKDLISKIYQNQSNFLFHLVNKAYGEKSFVMLHCQPR